MIGNKVFNDVPNIVTKTTKSGHAAKGPYEVLGQD